MFDLAASWDFTRSADGQISADDILRLACDLKASNAALKPFMYVSMKNYNRLRYYSHLGRCRPLPRRRLRKCHLRKVDRFLKRERRRYHL